MAAQGDRVPFTAGPKEFSFDVVFSAPAAGNGGRVLTQEGSCSTPAGETVSFMVNDDEPGSAHGMRLFAGARWDPFIMDAAA